MKRTLVCWLGATDIRASKGEESTGYGPIYQSQKKRTFDEIILLNNFPKKDANTYREWLLIDFKISFQIKQIKLSSPTNFGEIYESVVSVIDEIDLSNHQLTFHLSPGTPAMAAVWIILAKTRYPAELIESSREEGVKTVSIPFDISAEFIPNLLKTSDSKIEKLITETPPEAPEFESIIHRSSIMKSIINRARLVAPRSVPVLIEGESGTGKELFARAIHNASPRKEKPFIPINCGAIPAELIESELFGHIKGAFTGAAQNRKGCFEAADKGTLFLDEVGELPLSAQVKLLRVLQEKEVTPIGSSKSKSIDIRIVSATNRNLIVEISNGRFRSDLFYRLGVAILRLPPLRKRAGDISLLIDKLMDQINEEAKNDIGIEHKNISPGAKNLLLKHPWHGNIRELQNTLRRAAIWSSGQTISKSDIDESLLKFEGSGKDNILDRPMKNEFNLNDILSEVSTHYIERALQETNQNKTEAAQLLGLPSYQTLTNWMKKYGVE